MKTPLFPSLLVLLLSACAACSQITAPKLTYGPRTNVVYVGDRVAYSFGGSGAAQNIINALQLGHVKLTGPEGFAIDKVFTNNVGSSMEALEFDPPSPGDYRLVWRARTGYPFSGSNVVNVLPRTLQLVAVRSVLSLGETTPVTLAGEGITSAWFKTLESFSLECSVGLIETNGIGSFTYLSKRPGSDTVKFVARTRGGIDLKAQVQLVVNRPELHLTTPSEVTLGDGLQFAVGLTPSDSARHLAGSIRVLAMDGSGVTQWQTNLPITAVLQRPVWVPSVPGKYSIEARLDSGQLSLSAKAGLQVMGNELKLSANPPTISVGGSVQFEARSRLTNTVAWLASSTSGATLLHFGPGFTNPIPLGLHLREMKPLKLDLPGQHRFVLQSAAGVVEARVSVLNPVLDLAITHPEVTLADPQGVQLTVSITPPEAARHLTAPIHIVIKDDGGVTRWETNLPVVAFQRVDWLPNAIGRYSVAAQLDRGAGQSPLHAKGGLGVVSNGLKLSASPTTIPAGGGVRLMATSRLSNTSAWLTSVASGSALLHISSGTTNVLPLGIHLLNSQPVTLVQPGLHRFVLTTPAGVASTEVNVEAIVDGIPMQAPLSRPLQPGVPFLITAPVPELPYREVEIGFVVDVTGSMRQEIMSMQIALSRIYEAARLLAPKVRGAIFTYAGLIKGTGEIEVDFSLRAALTSDPAALSSLNLRAIGPGPEAPFASLQLAAHSPGWGRDSVKILLVLTDDIDHFFASVSRTARGGQLASIVERHYERTLDWKQGAASAVDILTELKTSGFAVGALISEDQVGNLTQEYADVLNHHMGKNSLGAYKLESADQLVIQVRDAVKRLVAQKAAISLRERVTVTGQSVLKSIRPVQPAACIVNGAFSYQLLVEAGEKTVTFECIPSSGIPEQAAFIVEATNEAGAVSWRQPIVRVTSRAPAK